MALLAAVAALLHRYTGEADLLIGTYFSGRNRRELAGVVGLFLNTVTLRTDLSGRPSFRDLMRRVRADLLEGYAHQDLPFPMLLQSLFPADPPSRTLLSRVSFNMLSFSLGDARPPAGVPELIVEAVAAREESQAKHDLTFSCQESPDSIQVALSAATDLFDPASVAGMVEDYACLLAQVVDDPAIPLDLLLPEPLYRPAPRAIDEPLAVSSS
jgi:non-ribosomal peptide synthetase component F